MPVSRIAILDTMTVSRRVVEEWWPQETQETQKGRIPPFAFLEFFAAIPLVGIHAIVQESLSHLALVHGPIGNVSYWKRTDLNLGQLVPLAPAIAAVRTPVRTRSVSVGRVEGTRG